MSELDGPSIILRRLLSPAEHLAFIEAFAGGRVYIPVDGAGGPRRSRLHRVLNEEAVARLSVELGGSEIKVPLERALRVKIYRERGDSWGKIANKLGMTESQVGKLLLDAGMTNGPEARRRRAEAQKRRARQGRGNDAKSVAKSNA